MPTSLKEFEKIFPTLVNDLKEYCEKYQLPEQALKWFEQVSPTFKHEYHAASID